MPSDSPRGNFSDKLSEITLWVPRGTGRFTLTPRAYSASILHPSIYLIHGKILPPEPKHFSNYRTQEPVSVRACRRPDNLLPSFCYYYTQETSDPRMVGKELVQGQGHSPGDEEPWSTQRPSNWPRVGEGHQAQVPSTIDLR